MLVRLLAMAGILSSGFGLATCASQPGMEGLYPSATAALFYANAGAPGISSFVCSGTIVGNAVITAAHCTDDDQPLEVAVGPVDLCTRTPIETAGVALLRHPDRRIDVAVLVPEETLPPGEPPPVGRSGGWSATGWGSAPGSYRCGSRTVDLVSTDGCTGRSTDDLCLTGLADNTCIGDSGAGVIDPSGRLVAVTSHGSGCAPGDPGVYASLEPISAWLSDAMVAQPGTVAGTS
jgi:hypothetical protein